MENAAATRVPEGASLLEAARNIAPDLIELRRDLHRHPELSYQEKRTADIAANALASLGLEVRRGLAGTGVVGELVIGEDGTAGEESGAAGGRSGTAGGEGATAGGKSGAVGRTIAIRADMDALPIQEESDVPYASTAAGIMHACGHDAHTSALIGAARLLVQASREGRLPPGRIRFLFQPSEEQMDAEGKSGGRRMVEEGALHGVDAVVGSHVGAHLDPGKIYVREGPIFGGSDELEVTVRGRSAHAARPHEGVDALVLAAQGVVAVQQAVSRRIDPMEGGVVTFGTIQGGRAMNVLADRVTLTGTLRYFSLDVRDRLRDAVRAAFNGLEAHGAEVEVRVIPGYPPVVNDAGATARVRQGLSDLLGPDHIQEVEPVLLAEDFSYLAQEAPGVFFWVGAGLPDRREHHHPRFDIDESAISLAAAALAGAAVTLLDEPR